MVKYECASTSALRPGIQVAEVFWDLERSHKRSIAVVGDDSLQRFAVRRRLCRLFGINRMDGMGRHRPGDHVLRPYLEHLFYSHI